MSDDDVKISFAVDKGTRDRFLEILQALGAPALSKTTEEEEEQLPLPPEEVYRIVRREAKAGKVVLEHASSLIDEAWGLLARYEFGGHTKAMFGPGTRLNDCYQSFNRDLTDAMAELGSLIPRVGSGLMSKMDDIRLEVEEQIEAIRKDEGEEQPDWGEEDYWDE